MQHEAEFRFFCKLMENLHIRTRVFPPDQPPTAALGFEPFDGYDAYARRFFARAEKHTLCVVQDVFFFSFCYMLLPESGDVFLVGPYLLGEVSEHDLMTLLEHNQLSPSLFAPLRSHLAGMPVLHEEDHLITQLETLCETLWDGAVSFDLKRVKSDSLLNRTEAIASFAPADADNFRISEQRYEYEKELTHLVSLGRTNSAQALVTRMLEQHIDDIALECCTANPLRNMKNYGIVLNTLLRKAVEEGGVHPLHIGQLAAQMAQRLEATRSREECGPLFTSMVHKYCLLVRNHSMKGYSPLVQHVILRIEADLTANLSLKSHAEALNVNASYLSTLFKKETGMTLTDYVTRMRMDNAIFMLNTTEMQVQTIAQYCGIPDVNYFTKTFKRLIGKTPKEYRIQARSADTKES